MGSRGGAYGRGIGRGIWEGHRERHMGGAQGRGIREGWHRGGACTCILSSGAFTCLSLRFLVRMKPLRPFSRRVRTPIP